MAVDTQIDEEYLIEEARSDPAKFGKLYDQHFEIIYRFIHRRVREKEVAKDITQQVFLKALQSLPKYTHRGKPFSSYLYRIAINECNLFFRDNEKVRFVTINDVFQGALKEKIGGDKEGHEGIWLERLGTALERLKEGELMLIELRFFEKRAFKEIGSILDITENLAKVRVYRILKRLKKDFQKNYEA